MRKDKKILFDEIYRTNKDKIYRLCLGFLGNTIEADDLFQEILIKVWNNLDGFRNESKVSTWIYRVATNTALMYVNKKKRVLSKTSNTPVENLKIENPEYKEDQQIKINQLYKTISQLKEINKIIITLVLEGCSYEEISDITGLTVNHVGVKVNRIKNQLKKKLNRHE